MVAVPDEHAGIRRLDRVEAELERGHDAEAATAAAHGPEELAVLRRVGPHVLTVREDELDRREAVGGEAELAGVPADAAAEAVAGDADVGRAAVQRRETVVGGGLGRVDPQRTTLDAGNSPGRVDGDLAHPLGAQHDDVLQALGDERAGVVARRLGSDAQAGVGRGAHDLLHVRDGRRQRDGGRPLVDGHVPRQAGGLVGRVTGKVHRAVAESGKARGRPGGVGEVDGHASFLPVVSWRPLDSWWRARGLRGGWRPARYIQRGSRSRSVPSVAAAGGVYVVRRVPCSGDSG